MRVSTPDMVRAALLLLFALAAACGDGAGPLPPAAAAPPARESWWTAATDRGGAERVLAPREMRALLAEGRGYGLDRDAAWFKAKQEWVFARVLEMDPDDVEANAALGRATLQSLPEFEALWLRMLETRYPDRTISELLDQFDPLVQEERPIFLSADEVQLVLFRLRSAREHLDRLESEPGYAALEGALARVRGSVLGDYPYVHVQAGPFLVFFAARDLQRIEGADAAAEDRRIGERQEYYKKRLAERAALYGALMDDLRATCPEVFAKHPLAPQDIFHQWIFADREWYQDFTRRIRAEGQEAIHRCGFFEGATGWAYLFEPPARDGPPPAPGEDAPADLFDPDSQLSETMAYLAATQVLWRWGRDSEDFTVNHMERTEAYWLKEGWASFFAARRVESPMVGPLLREAKRFGWVFPPLRRILERRSRLDVRLYQDPVIIDADAPEDLRPLTTRASFTDIAWLLVAHLTEEERRAAFTRYFLSQVEGSRKGLDWFEECFGITTTEQWKKLERAVYARVRQ